MIHRSIEELSENNCLRVQFVFNRLIVNLFPKLKAFFVGKAKPEHLRRGTLGEQAAKKHLRKLGLRFLTANFKSERGEIELVFRDGDCLVFVEVKARSSESWTRPAAAVSTRQPASPGAGGEPTGRITFVAGAGSAFVTGS